MNKTSKNFHSAFKLHQKVLRACLPNALDGYAQFIRFYTLLQVLQDGCVAHPLYGLYEHRLWASTSWPLRFLRLFFLSFLLVRTPPTPLSSQKLSTSSSSVSWLWPPVDTRSILQAISTRFFLFFAHPISVYFLLSLATCTPGKYSNNWIKLQWQSLPMRSRLSFHFTSLILFVIGRNIFFLEW